MSIRTEPGPWVAYRKPSPHAAMRLFCFPYAGAGACLYRSWGAKLPSNVEVCPVELPGRGLRVQEPAFDRIEPLIQALSEALLPFLDRPFALFGHSLGALVGFELARMLKRHGCRSPDCLVVSACRAPQEREEGPRFSDLTDEQFIGELKRLNGTPTEVLANDELMEIMLPTLRSDFAICEHYRYVDGDPLSIPIISFAGSDDTMVRREHIEPWRDVTTASWEMKEIPGDHFFLTTSESIVLSTLQEVLAFPVGTFF